MTSETHHRLVKKSDSGGDEGAVHLSTCSFLRAERHRQEHRQVSGGYVTQRVVERSYFEKPTQTVSRSVLLFSPLGDAAFN